LDAPKPKIVSAEEYAKARDELLEAEKEVTHLTDRVAAHIRQCAETSRWDLLEVTATSSTNRSTTARRPRRSQRRRSRRAPWARGRGW
jgi:hypothetical protein